MDSVVVVVHLVWHRVLPEQVMPLPLTVQVPAVDEPQLGVLAEIG